LREPDLSSPKLRLLALKFFPHLVFKNLLQLDL